METFDLEVFKAPPLAVMGTVSLCLWQFNGPQMSPLALGVLQVSGLGCRRWVCCWAGPVEPSDWSVELNEGGLTSAVGRSARQSAAIMVRSGTPRIIVVLSQNM